MRRWFFVLMILLLPLRGWVGDAMAMQMAVPGQHAPSSAMQHADGNADSAQTLQSSTALAAADDCGGHAGAQDTNDSMDATHCEACAMCQTCHTVAVLLLPEVLSTAQVSPMAPPSTKQLFASVDRALLLKPPID